MRKTKTETKTALHKMSARELFQYGGNLARRIREHVEENRAYYLGQSRCVPRTLLHEVFDPETGGTLDYFVRVIRFINRHGFLGGWTHLREYHDLKRESNLALEAMRRFAIELAPFLDKPHVEKRKRIGRSLKLSIHFFCVAKDRFFAYLSWRSSILYLLMKNYNNEGFGIYVADRLLNDIAKAFEMRERQLMGLPEMPEHSFFSYSIEKKLDVIAENTRQIPLLVRFSETLTGKIVRKLSTVIVRSTNETYAGCHHPDKKKDKVVQRVIQYLAKEGVTFSINNACIKIAGADRTGHCRESWLYGWCNEHKREIETAVAITRATNV